jgi:hypothetical protein
VEEQGLASRGKWPVCLEISHDTDLDRKLGMPLVQILAKGQISDDCVRTHNERTAPQLSGDARDVERGVTQLTGTVELRIPYFTITQLSTAWLLSAWHLSSQGTL